MINVSLDDGSIAGGEDLAPTISRLGIVPPGTGFARPAVSGAAPPPTDTTTTDTPTAGGGTGPNDLSTTYRTATADELAAGKSFWYNVTGGGYYGLPPGQSAGTVTTLPVAQSVPNDGTLVSEKITPSSTVASATTPVDDTASQLLAAATGAGGGFTGGTDLSGMGGVPAGVPLTTTTASSGTNPLVLLLLVAVAVGGYFLYVHYKGKIKKKEGA